MGCVCMCKLQPTRVCQLLTCSSPIKATPGRRNAVLCPFWTSLPLRLPAASSFSFSFCHSAFSHSLSRFVSPSLCIWITSLPSLMSLLSCMPPRSEVLSHSFCICHVSVFLLFPFFPSLHLLAGHISPLRCLTNPKCSSELKPHYLCLSWLVFSLLPLVWLVSLLFYSPSTSYLPSPGCCTYSLPDAAQPLIFTFTLVILLPLIFS